MDRFKNEFNSFMYEIKLNNEPNTIKTNNNIDIIRRLVCLRKAKDRCLLVKLQLQLYYE